MRHTSIVSTTQAHAQYVHRHTHRRNAQTKICISHQTIELLCDDMQLLWIVAFMLRYAYMLSSVLSEKEQQSKIRLFFSGLDTVNPLKPIFKLLFKMSKGSAWPLHDFVYSSSK